MWPLQGQAPMAMTSAGLSMANPSSGSCPGHVNRRPDYFRQDADGMGDQVPPASGHGQVRDSVEILAGGPTAQPRRLT
jgi:hypothetical protein